MDASAIRRVLIVGSGTMGVEIGFQCAWFGCEVTLHDTSPEALAATPQRLREYGGSIVAAGYLAADGLEAALSRIAFAADPAAPAADADLVIECVPDDPALKARVFAALDALCPPRTIFATNTSMLVPSMFADASGRPDRLAALHFHLPVWSARVADVMPHPGTDPATTALLVAFARRIGQIPIELRQESHGYVFNAIYSAINRESIALVANGVTSVEDVDRSWMAIFHMPVGPFGMLDEVGLDTVLHITAFWAAQLKNAQLERNAALLRGYVDQGFTGRKAGRGFYSYPDPAFARPGFVEGTPAG